MGKAKVNRTKVGQIGRERINSKEFNRVVGMYSDTEQFAPKKKGPPHQKKRHKK
jgi:hypothetical protein